MFCPHCGAPQIRVLVAEPATALAPAVLATRDQAPLPASETVPVLAVPTRWSQSAQPCALAALIAALSIVLQLMAPLIAPIGAGFLAVAFYRRRNPEILIGAQAGAKLGAICGFFCFGMTAILAAVRVAILHESDAIRNFLLEAVRQTATRYSDPQFQEGLDFLRSSTGLAFMMILLLIIGLILSLVLGTLGGAVGGALLNRRARQ